MTTMTLDLSAVSRIETANVSDLSLDESILSSSGLPDLDAETLEKIRLSLIDEGPIEPLIVWARGEQMIVIDGAARFRLMREMGMSTCPIRLRESTGEAEAVAYRIKKNMTRRHMTLWMRARAAAESVLLNSAKRGNGKGNKWNEIEQIFGVKRDSVEKARDILDGKNNEPNEGDHEKLIAMLEERYVYKDSEGNEKTRSKKIHGAWCDVKRWTDVNAGKEKLPTNTLPICEPPKGVAQKPLKEIINQLHQMDWRDGLRMIPDESVDLIITSPPYHGIMEDYNGAFNECATFEEYLAWMNEGMAEFPRILKTGGLVCINCANITSHPNERSKQYRYAQTHETYRALTDAGLNYFDEICWDRKKSTGKPQAGGGNYPRLKSRKESIILCSKGVQKNRDTGYTYDLTDDERLEWSEDVWHIAIEKSPSRKGKHPFVFSEALPTRLIKLFSNPGALVLDPFCGSGSTCSAAAKLQRHFIGIDKDAGGVYLPHARQRVAEAQEVAVKK